tara:strand:+ start:261 stop:1211 length:951 start_codon:yes stop_codon:yes gene_type:complete
MVLFGNNHPKDLSKSPAVAGFFVSPHLSLHSSVMKVNRIIKLILLTLTVAYSYIFAQTQVVVTEVMFMDAPYIGEVITTTTKYVAEGLFRQESAVDVDRFLIRLAMGGNKTLGSILDGKNEIRIVYNAKDEEFAQETFDMIRDNDGKISLQGMRQFDVGGSNRRENSDQENADDDVEQENVIQRNISNETENIAGFNTRKVTTLITSDDGTMMIEEWFTTDTVLFHYVLDIEKGLVESYGGKKQNMPRSISESMLVQSEHDYDSVDGILVKYTMEMKDEDDAGFRMNWELKSIREMPLKPSDFEIYRKYEKVDELD